MAIYKKMGINLKLLEEIKSILVKNSKIDKTVIFGSRARGDYKKTSDIDICIYSKTIDHMDINLIEDQLKQLNTVLDFDVIHFESISKKSLKDNIERDGVEIYVKD